MKIAVIGGAGTRTPLLVKGLAQSDLPIDEIALFDIDLARLELIGGVAAAFSPLVRTYQTAASCVRDAQFVFISIRVGGIEARARDERIALRHGVVGQETVGPGGFAMAVRTIPHVVAYARLVEREAPDAWIINFTNPVGIVTQAALSQSDARIIGICDTPAELFEDVAALLRLDPSRCRFDYFGLNHLGWLREVYCDGRPRLAQMWTDAELLKRVYRSPLFGVAFLKDLRLLPTEYLFYYYNPWEAFENMRRAGQTRGEVIARLNAELFETLGRHDVDRATAYAAYLAARNAGYMQIETGAGRLGGSEDPPLRTFGIAGYDRIALAVVRAIAFHSNAIIPLDVTNRGVIGDLESEDVVEVPCVVNSNGATPLHVAAVPDSVRELLTRVKAYERLTIEAAVLHSSEAAHRALATNPLVGHPDLARELLADMDPL